jgi:hypothetical protein
MKKFASFVIAASILALVVVGGVDRLDEMGWVPHRQVTRVMVPVEQPWVFGEFLDCVAEPHPGMTIRGYGSNWIDSARWIDSLACARDWKNGHIMQQELQVTYWGRTRIPYPESARLYARLMAVRTNDPSYPYNSPFRWRCRRNNTSVTCWAVN